MYFCLTAEKVLIKLSMKRSLRGISFKLLNKNCNIMLKNILNYNIMKNWEYAIDLINIFLCKAEL